MGCWTSEGKGPVGSSHSLRLIPSESATVAPCQTTAKSDIADSLIPESCVLHISCIPPLNDAHYI